MKIDIFYPCSNDGFTDVNRKNLIKILNHVGDTPIEPEIINCCGQMEHLQGYSELAKTNGEHLILSYQIDRPIIMASTSCLGYIRIYYNKFFFNTALHNEFKQFSKNICDITEYLVNIKKQTNLNAYFESRVSYYHSCSASQKCKINKEPITLLEEVSSLTLTEYDNIGCCGAGGLFPKTHPEYSEKLALVELNKMLEFDTEYITSTDASCLNHLQKIINKHNLKLKTIHIVDILASGITQ